jgi:hypothetical protein
MRQGSEYSGFNSLVLDNIMLRWISRQNSPLAREMMNHIPMKRRSHMRKMVLLIPLLLVVSIALSQQEFFPLAKGAKWEYRVTFPASTSLPYLPKVEYPEGLMASSIFSGMGSWTAGQINFEVLLGDIAEKTATSTSWKIAANVLFLKFLFYRTDTARDACHLRLATVGTSIQMDVIDLLTAVNPPWRLVKSISQLSASDLAVRYSITVPAGQFTNCASCTMTLNGDGIYVPTGAFPVETYLAPGLGIVKAIGKDRSGVTQYVLELTRFTAGSAVKTENSPEMPKEFALLQNYPNPFNPSTTIQFDVARTGFVTLKIYSMLGNEIETLIASTLSPGGYSVKWNASNRSSGVYFCRMQARDFIMTRKLILLK